MKYQCASTRLRGDRWPKRKWCNLRGADKNDSQNPGRSIRSRTAKGVMHSSPARVVCDVEANQDRFCPYASVLLLSGLARHSKSPGFARTGRRRHTSGRSPQQGRTFRRSRRASILGSGAAEAQLRGRSGMPIRGRARCEGPQSRQDQARSVPAIALPTKRRHLLATLTRRERPTDTPISQEARHRHHLDEALLPYTLDVGSEDLSGRTMRDQNR